MYIYPLQTQFCERFNRHRSRKIGYHHVLPFLPTDTKISLGKIFHFKRLMKKHAFFCLKSVWDFQKWTKKMSKNRKSQNSLEKKRKKLFCDHKKILWSDTKKIILKFVTIIFFHFLKFWKWTFFGDFLCRIL